MGHDEEMQIRGQMLTDFMKAKEELILLRHKAERLSKLISFVGGCLHNPLPLPDDLFTAEHYAALDPEQIKALVTELNGTHARKLHLGRQLGELGIPVLNSPADLQ